MSRRLCADHLGEDRQELADRRGVVVADVQDRPRRRVLERGKRRRRGVGDVAEGPHAAAVTDDRELAGANHVPLVAARCHPGARAVEPGVAQHGAARVGDDLLNVPDRCERRAQLLRGVRHQRVVLVLDGPAGRLVRPAGERLCDDGRADLEARGDEVVGALGAQAIGHRERLLQAPQVTQARQRGHLVHDRVGLGGSDGVDQAVAVEAVDDDRRDAERPQLLRLGGGSSGACDGMSVVDQLGNQGATDGTGGAREENVHAAPTRRHENL